ncbi:tyrosine-type recombinase/integrase [Sphingomonas sp. 35-24ZXX]|uniref:tyrosine-type recombinase/integrase n=1 Tax=Sphingomonas sp. 35-24ZXX TaxID=1545915 RepID=UPI00053BEF45|nr:site-specific integrase [Sphingomonas sp. 35-24ZXX]
MAAATTLTDAKLKGLKPPVTGQVELSDAQVPGLRARISPRGSITFIIRKRIGDRVRNITVGRYGERFGIAAARKHARTILSDIEAGKDPTTALASQKRTGAAGGTIRALWPAYKASKADLRSIGEVERIFDRYILPALGDRMADAVTRADVSAAIDKIAETAPVMGRAVHAQLSAFYSWAMPRLDRLPSNPCRDAGRPAKPKARDRVLTDDELRALWLEAEAQPLPWGAAVKLLVLTGQRRSEVFEAEWPEFDLDAGVWTIPAARAKNGAAHIVPLSGDALAVLSAIPRTDGSDRVFPAAGNADNSASGISKAVNRYRTAIDKALCREGGDRWTLHDIRRTVATGLQRLGVRFEVTEAVLNHVSGSKGGIAGVYQRHDWAAEKRTALDAWAVELRRVVHGEADAGNVVSIGGAA